MHMCRVHLRQCRRAAAASGPTLRVRIGGFSVKFATWTDTPLRRRQTSVVAGTGCAINNVPQSVPGRGGRRTDPTGTGGKPRVPHTCRPGPLQGHQRHLRARSRHTALLTFADVCPGAARFTDLICRFGGEECSPLLPGAGSEEAETLSRQISERIAVPSNTSPVTTSSYPTRDIKADPRAADDALYRAKAQGRDPVLHARALS